MSGYIQSYLLHMNMHEGMGSKLNQFMIIQLSWNNIPALLGQVLSEVEREKIYIHIIYIKINISPQKFPNTLTDVTGSHGNVLIRWMVHGQVVVSISLILSL